jgi:hypothetical protein
MGSSQALRQARTAGLRRVHKFETYLQPALLRKVKEVALCDLCPSAL